MFVKGEYVSITDMISDTLEGYEKTQESMHEIETIAKQSKMLANNAAREFGRLEMAGNVQIITQQIKSFAKSSMEINERNKEHVEELVHNINHMVGVRTADVASDLIEKIERSLFERKSNVEAWASFEVFKDYAKDPSEENCRKIAKTLKNLHRIYGLYYDIFFADEAGIVKAAAVREEANGRDISNTEWFKETKNSEDAIVTDMHVSEAVHEYVVSYSIRILDDDGKFIGVLTTRFDWNHILKLIDDTKISGHGEIYLINKDGLVIAARERELIFHKNMLLECQGAQTILANEMDKLYGYAIEVNEQEQLTRVLGYAKSQGYLKYQGMQWAVLALENIKEV
ncbi:MAG: hypothetical protein IIT46_09305 [Lachnospiraceae bacterium]|nr:hypothetical protein [Lachnospiraceae bacterium]